jgi:hypothetical protein
MEDHELDDDELSTGGVNRTLVSPEVALRGPRLRSSRITITRGSPRKSISRAM